MGKDTHLSLFLVIERGAFDAVLSWPLRSIITFILLDQGNMEHVVDTV